MHCVVESQAQDAFTVEAIVKPEVTNIITTTNNNNPVTSTTTGDGRNSLKAIVREVLMEMFGKSFGGGASSQPSQPDISGFLGGQGNQRIT